MKVGKQGEWQRVTCLPNRKCDRIACPSRVERLGRPREREREHVCLSYCSRLLRRAIISPLIMDLRPPSPSSQQIPHHNAVAGPSSIPLNPPFFLLPPGSYHFPLTLTGSISPFPLLVSPPPPPFLESTQDLISRFHLLSAYDKFVRPFISQEHDPHASHLPTTPAVAPSADKGKGKERDPGTPTIASAATPGTHDPDDDEGRDGKKKKNTYRHLIRGIPGA